MANACTCLEVFGEDPDCPRHGYDALKARIADLEALIDAQHGDVVARTAKLLYEKDDEIAAQRARAATATAIMSKAHTVMRECGWHLAVAAESSGDGILEAACTEVEAEFQQFLGGGSAD